MNLLLAALDEQGYIRIKPLVENLRNIHQQQAAKRLGKLPKDAEVNRIHLIEEEIDIRLQIVNASTRLSKQTVNLFEYGREITALHEILFAFGQITPKAQLLLKELGDYLISAEKLGTLYPSIH